MLTNSQATRIAYVLTALIGCACLYGGWLLLQLLWFEIQPVQHGGGGLTYIAMGRGILNGLVPYRDLFEFKPPGIFLIGASSLFLFGDNTLGNLVQAAAELGILLLLCTPLIRRMRERAWRCDVHEWLLLIATAAIGLLLVIYVGDLAGRFQTESIGSFTAIAYLLFVSREKKMTTKHMMIAAALLLCAIGLKEPFLVVIVAASLVLVPLRRMRRTFLVPLAVAALVGTALLFALGYLQPYVTIYVPEILNGRSSFNPYPIWAILFNARILARDVWVISPPLLIAMTILWTLSLTVASGAHTNMRALRALAVLMLSSLVLYDAAARFVIMAESRLTSFDQVHPATDALLIPVILGTLASIVATYLGLRAYLGRENGRRVFGAWICHGTAVLITVAIVLMQGAYTQHQATIAPLCAALVFACLCAIMKERDPFSPSRTLYAAAGAVAAFGLFVFPAPDYPAMLRDEVRAEETAATQARDIDGLMTACGYNRYVIFGSAEGTVPYAYTHHSPYGPAFLRIAFTFPVKWRSPPIPYLQDTYRKHLQEAEFVIAKKITDDGKQMIDSTDIPDDVWNTFSANFTREPPPCAAPFRESGDMAFRFRKR